MTASCCKVQTGQYSRDFRHSADDDEEEGEDDDDDDVACVLHVASHCGSRICLDDCMAGCGNTERLKSILHCRELYINAVGKYISVSLQHSSI